MSEYTLDLGDDELSWLKTLLTNYVDMALLMMRSPVVISQERAEELRVQVELATKVRGKLPV